MNRTIQIARWAAAAALVATVGLQSDTVAAQADGELVDLVVQGGSPSPTLAYLPMYVAQNVGFFEEEGIEVEIRYGRGAPLAAQMVVAGNADLSSMTFEPLLLGYDEGIRGKFFYQYSNEVIYSMAVPADSSIETPADLEGRSIGVASMSSASLPIARAILRDAGLDPDSDVNFVPVGVGGPALQALDSGEVDALSLWLEAYAAMEGEGRDFRKFTLPAFDEVGNAGYFAADALEDKPDALRGFVRAVAKANEFMKENPEAAVRILWDVSQDFRGSGSEEEALAGNIAAMQAMQTAWRGTDNERNAYGYITPEAVEIYQEVLMSEGVIDQVLPVDEIITNDMIDYANDFDIDEVRQLARDWGN